MQKSAKEITWSLLSKGTTMILFILINLYLARKLSLEEYGLWSYFFSIITIISLISYFGINASAKKYAAQNDQTDSLRPVIKSSIKLRFYFSLAFSILLLLSYKSLASLLNKPEFEKLFLLSIPLIFLSSFVEFYKEMFSALQKLKYNFIVNFLEYSLKFLLVLIFFTFSINVFYIINAYLISVLITGLVGSYLLYFNFYRKYKRSKEKYSKQILKYSLPLFFSTLGFVMATEIDTFMLGLLVGESEVAIYAVSKQIITKLPHISLAIALAVMPLFSKINKDNKEKLKKSFYNLMKINCVIFIPIIVIILLFSGYFIPLIYGYKYSNAVIPLKILTVYLFLFTNSIFLNSFLDYNGLAKKRAINILILIVVNIILNLILIPKYGAIGAAIATSISYAPSVLLSWFEVKKFISNL